MTQEEKAKCYDEAIERAKVFKKHLLEINEKDYADEMNYIFPALKESEDEKIRKALIYHYRGDGCICTNEYRIDNKDIRTWLEKQGEQKPAEWSEEDKKMLKELINYCDTSIQYNGIDSPQAIKWKKRKEWLKSLKDRVQPQPKQEWSEEDEKMLKDTIRFCELCGNKVSANWLKSIKERYAWKPSDEQMNTLEQWLKDNQYKGDVRYCYPIFESLYHDLKKLREE